jgi:hypothetical protein
LSISNYPETLKALHTEFNWPFPVLLPPSVYFNPLYRSLNFISFLEFNFVLFVFQGDKDSTTSSTDNNGHHSDSGLGPNDRNGDHGILFKILKRCLHQY